MTDFIFKYAGEWVYALKTAKHWINYYCSESWKGAFLYSKLDAEGNSIMWMPKVGTEEKVQILASSAFLDILDADSEGSAHIQIYVNRYMLTRLVEMLQLNLKLKSKSSYSLGIRSYQK